MIICPPSRPSINPSGFPGDRHRADRQPVGREALSTGEETFQPSGADRPPVGSPRWAGWHHLKSTTEWRVSCHRSTLFVRGRIRNTGTA